MIGGGKGDLDVVDEEGVGVFSYLKGLTKGDIK